MRDILLFCLLFSCGKNQSEAQSKPLIIQPRIVATPVENDPRGSLSIAPELLPLVDKFEGLWGGKVRSPIWFSYDLPPNALAVCHTFTRTDGLTLTEIVIQKSYYKQGSISAEITLFHELGHCELKRDHDSSLARLDDGQFVAFSIMYPSILDEDDYEKFKDHYMLELFKRGNLLTKFEPED